MSLKVQNISYQLKSRLLLDALSFEAHEGEMKVIIGPNGAGKTTLLKIVSRILKQQQGHLYLNEQSIDDFSPRDISKILSYMPQFSEFPSMRVLEVLELGRYTSAKGRIKKEDRMLIEQMIADLSLEKVLDKNIATLSGGERQKVLLAASLIQEPKILILDEPISSLDPKNQLEVLKIIKKMTKERHIITLIVLHDIQHALHYGDALLMLKQGRVFKEIRTHEIEAAHLNQLFEVESKLFKEEHHTFIYYTHSHENHDKWHTH
ncbi:ABC transporter ATP-binding protein [Sulfurospirillum sp. 1612]|uniref:ABC transporter ATP-binding protein n=1 Tax=Sulfurospirillum sp. 1612 TaxID=3094835 RepID=UPI002F92D130